MHNKLGGMPWNCSTVRYTPKHGSWLNKAEIKVTRLSSPYQHRMELHAHTGAKETLLLNQADTVLAPT
jgi:hypothetical protein